MKAKHEKIYKCTECRRSFDHPRKLNIHLKMAHDTDYKIKIMASSYAYRIKR